jgi:hypothetical protein
MFIPNSPSPPRGIAVSVCVVLLKECFSPSLNLKSYHSAPFTAGQPFRQLTRSPIFGFSLKWTVGKSVAFLQLLLGVQRFVAQAMDLRVPRCPTRYLVRDERGVLEK